MRPNKTVLFSLLLGLPLLLGSCAPATSSKGNSSLTPLVMPDATSPLTINPGETRYYQYTYPRDALNLGENYFSKLDIDFSNTSGNNVNSVEAYASWLQLQTPKTPKGVKITVEKAFITKDIDKTSQEGGKSVVYYYERFKIIFKVTAAADAAKFNNTINLTFSDGTSKDTVPLLLQVGYVAPTVKGIDANP